VLDTFAKQDYPCEEYEVLLVDNASTDNTKSLANSYIENHKQHNIRYIYEPVVGLLSGRHRGALESKGEILLFADDDIQLYHDALKIIEDSFNQKPAMGLMGAKYIPNYQAPPPKWLDSFWSSTPYGGRMCGYLSLLDLGNKPLTIDARYVWGLFYAVRKSVLFECGGFNPDLCPVGYLQGDGETGLSDKINNSTFETYYNPAIIVKHDVPSFRMTKSYFKKRDYFQGHCNSYTDIRNGKREIETYKPIKNKIVSKKSIRQFLSDIKCLLIHGYAALYARKLKVGCAEKHREGYCFHNNMALNNPEILEWVLKPDYWDYKYPDLSKIKEVSLMPDSKISLHR
jgi:glycosyltransferase involved in cell wall biosynthesis